jgi:hypothetical protein
VQKLVLIDAMGLWRDDAPVEDHLVVSPQKLVKLLFHDPSKPEVEMIQKAGHLPQVEQRKVVSGHLERFLAG